MRRECAVYQAANILGKRWTLLILLALYNEQARPKRYSMIKKALSGISPKLLSSRLKELEKEGLIKKRIDTRTMPITCEYSFTKSGEEFIHIVMAIKKWAIRQKGDKKFCQGLSCKDCAV
ncbi:helix-turn-helix transcriptional regulator [Candidatus Woesearchaeota archaeon]|nr:helix-turn-helix transcriptional regulator [Candidatus Woesearchaeota archaeon]